MEGKIIYVDVDGTLCTQVEDANYRSASPIMSMINKINKLYECNTIIIWTARGETTGIDWKELTKEQLDAWGVKYHDLRMHKPHYDLFICDKSIHPKEL